MLFARNLLSVRPNRQGVSSSYSIHRVVVLNQVVGGIHNAVRDYAQSCTTVYNLSKLTQWEEHLNETKASKSH